MANTGKLLIVGATAMVAMLIMANAEVKSDARAYTAGSRQTVDVVRAAPFQTNMIYGSDVSISEYPLENTPKSDW
jgi:hypothetical protein